MYLTQRVTLHTHGEYHTKRAVTTSRDKIPHIKGVPHIQSGYHPYMYTPLYVGYDT